METILIVIFLIRPVVMAWGSSGWCSGRNSMRWLLSATMLIAVGWSSVALAGDWLLHHPICDGIAAELVAEKSRVKAGERPRFSVLISNTADRPVQVLDLRNGRRVDPAR